MSTPLTFRMPTSMPQSSSVKTLFKGSVLGALTGIACLIAPQGASAASPTVTPRNVYADPCVKNTTGANPTINSTSCGTAWAPSSSTFKTVSTLTTTTGDYVAYPPSLPTSSTLVVLLGGTGSIPGSYTQFVERAAYNGYAAISLTYPDGSSSATAQKICGTNDTCYTNFRGGASFGTNTLYDKTSASTSYGTVPCASSSVCSSWVSSTSGAPQCTTLTDSTHINICPQDSVVGRLVAALKLLQVNVPAGVSPSAWNAYWGQFFTSASTTTSVYGGFPQWSRIILAGHSQGGGQAAFLAMNLPAGNIAKRVLLFSSPEDNISPDTANLGCGYNIVGNTNLTATSWISALSTSGITPSAFWGLRSGDTTGASTEGCYGAQAATSWSKLDGTGIPKGNATVIVDDGGCLVTNPNRASYCPTPPSGTGQHQFVISNTQASSDLYNHDDSAVDYGPLTVNLSQAVPDVAYVWDRMLTGSP